MAFCSKCGHPTEDDVKYCPNCGEPTGKNPDKEESAEQAEASSGAIHTAEYAEKKDAEENKLMAVLAYLDVLVLIPILCAPKSEFARYHANQGLLLWICSKVFSLITGAIGAVLGLFGLVTLATAIGFFSLVFFIFTVIGIVNACNGEKKELPIIGKYRILK